MSPLASVPCVAGAISQSNALPIVTENLVFWADADNNDIGHSNTYMYNQVNGPQSDSNNYRFYFPNSPVYNYQATLDGRTVSYWDFDGSNDYGYASNSDENSDFDLNNAYNGVQGDFTIEYWVRSDDSLTNNNTFPMGRWSANSNDQRSFLFGFESNRYQGMLWRDGFNSWSRPFITTTNDLSVFAADVWHHYVWSTRKANPDDSNNTYSVLYHNGELPSGNYTTNPYTALQNMTGHDGGSRDTYIGTPWYFSWCWDGQMSILRVYNGKALTANEVKRNYNADASKFGLTPL